MVPGGLVDTLLRHDWRELLLEGGLEACARNWEHSQRQLGHAIEAARASDFEVEVEPRFDRCSDWFERYQLVVLVAHSDGHRVEFLDRMVSFEELIASTPLHYAGHLDLVGCRTAHTADQLRFARPHMQVSHCSQRTPLDQQLLLLRGIFACMQQADLDYVDASVRLRKRWVERLSNQ